MNTITILILMATTTLITATGAPATEKDNPARQAIINLITNIFHGADERDWEKIQASLAPQVLVDYTSMVGGSAVTLTPAQITAGWKQLLPGFYSTHHQIGNFKINIKGNDATVTCSGLALHYLPQATGGDHWVVVGTYDYHVTKNEQGQWRVDKMTFHLQQQQGNLNLMATAQQNVKSGKTFLRNQVSAGTKAVVESFFTALEKMDIAAFTNVWAEDGKQHMPLSPENFPTLLDGRAAINTQYKDLPVNYTSMKFPRKYFATERPDVVIAQYNGIIHLKDGGEYNNNYVGIFTIAQGKVKQFIEYFDPAILQDAFGDKLASNFNVGAKSSVRPAEFLSKGLILRGTLHLPRGFSENKIYKGVIVTGSWTTVKEQMPDLYARKLADKGYVALTFDFRNYGESEGQPRNYEDPALKSEDLISAVSYLKSVKFIDGEHIGGLPICASTGYMILAVTKGAGFAAIAAVAPWLHNKEIVKTVYGGAEGVSGLIAKSNAAKTKFVETGHTDYVPAASATDKSAAMYGPFDYYLSAQRGAIAAWPNQFAVMAWRGWLEFDPIQYAGEINIPVQIVHSESAAIPDGVKMFYEKLKAPKNIVWLDGGVTQFDFYDQEKATNAAVEASHKWFERWLGE